MRRSSTFHQAQLHGLHDWAVDLPSEESSRVLNALRWATSNRGKGLCVTRHGFRFNGDDLYDALVWVKGRHREERRDTWTLDLVASMIYSEWVWDDPLTPLAAGSNEGAIRVVEAGGTHA